MNIVDDKTATVQPVRPATIHTECAPAAADPVVAPRKIAAGTKVRQYEIIRELGRGGMGEVFLARDTRLARRVALKFLTGSHGHNERFLAEARTTARCTHENIVVIHEVDEHDGTPYMVLEYLEGSTLRGVASGQRVSAGRAVELVLPIARALVRAHEFDIVHRDLKPENVFVTSAGTIKVLDFGIAKLLDRPSDEPKPAASDAASVPANTAHGAMMGTLPYMSPEQLGVDTVDHRTDLWAVGIMLFELVAGKHPLAPVTLATLVAHLMELDVPMPALGTDVPEPLQLIVRRCLAKRKADRFASALELRDNLEKLLPGQLGRRLGDDESPYPGLSSFQESDADRFFGRGHDIARVTARLREQPLIGIVGPSGVGKSSLVRAGVTPALKASGEAWDVRVVRPGRAPLASLAAILGDEPPDDLASSLAREPGALGALLRARASRDHVKLLIFIDQFEELYTLCSDEAQRRAFTACLSGVADDANGPLRIAIAMRSDFLDRVGEDPRFLDDLTRGLVFVQPLGRDGLRDALVRPIEPLGYAFESPQIADEMLDALALTPGALPLLQFAASRLWEARDRPRKWLTHAGYDAMGGISGALATHADQVLGTLAPHAQRLARSVFQRLVTPERTRAVVNRDELRGLATDAQSIDTIVDHLVAARLLVVQSQSEADGNTVEIVHESLISRWPTLRRWLDEDQDDAAYLAQVRTAARQWDQKGRAPGLLWRGDAEREARQFHARYRGELGAREQEFLDAVLRLGSRAARIRRGVLLGSLALLSVIAIASAVALVTISRAQNETEEQRANAVDAAHLAQEQTELARSAEAEIKAQLERLTAEQAARAKAEDEARAKGSDAQKSKEQLQDELVKEKQAKLIAEQESKKARDAEARAEAEAAAKNTALETTEALLQKEHQHAMELEERGKQIGTQLKK